MDLYRDAQLFPRTLRGRNLPASLADLTAQGVTAAAAQWRVSRHRVARIHRGTYLVGATVPDLLDRIRAALLVSPPVALVGFHTAAALLGFGVAASPDIHIVVPAGSPFPQRAGITVHQSVVPLGEPTVVASVPCTGPARTAVDLARTLRRADALSILDAALAANVCQASDIATELGRHTGLKGIRQARELIPLADPRSQCRQESHLRLILRDGGLVGFEPQVMVADDLTGTTYFIDLAHARRRIGAEYDGASHLDRERLRHDRERHNWLEGRGWRMRYFTDRDIYGRPDEIVHTLRRAAI